MGLQACIFSTAIGCLGLVGEEHCVWRLVIGHRCSEDAWASLRAYFGDVPLAESNWYPALKSKLTMFATGKPISFDDISVRTEQRTEFQKQVLIATRSIGFGETVSYGELAARVGSPRAARAVGSVMSSNSVPIIIPCHRVVGSGGALGGFSAPQGISLKQRLLDIEARTVKSRNGRRDELQ